MRLAHLRSAASIFTAFWLLGASQAHAGVLKCDSRRMSASDFNAVKSVARRAAGNHVLDWQKVSPCMNPGRGRVWIEAKAEPQADGSVVALALECLREARPWKCKILTRRWLKFSIPLAGREQQFVLDIPEHVSVEGVRRFTARAFETAGALTSLGYCGATPEDPPTSWDANAEVRLRETMALKGSPISGSIVEDAESTSLYLEDSVVLSFSRLPDDVDEKTFKCWSEIVVVT